MFREENGVAILMHPRTTGPPLLSEAMAPAGAQERSGVKGPCRRFSRECSLLVESFTFSNESESQGLVASLIGLCFGAGREGILQTRGVI